MVEISVYQSEDFSACLACMLSNTPKYFASDEVSLFETWLQAIEKGIIAHPLAVEQQFYVLKEKEELRACGGQLLSKEDDAVYLTWGMVHAEHHHKGFGAQLTAFRMHAIQERYPSKKIKIATSQHVAGFYAKNGFEITRILPAYYSPTIDRVEMEFGGKNVSN